MAQIKFLHKNRKQAFRPTISYIFSNQLRGKQYLCNCRYATSISYSVKYIVNKYFCAAISHQEEQISHNVHV